MVAKVILFSYKYGELNNFLSKFYNKNIGLEDSLSWQKEFSNPVDMSEIIAAFVDNDEPSNSMTMWISLDEDVFIKITSANADNVPISPLMNHDLDLIIVVHLTYTDQVDKRLYQQFNIIEIYPSSSLELINGSGTLNFNQASITEKIQTGYRDALVSLTPMLIANLKGKSMSPYIRHHMKWNDQFLKKYRK